MVSLTSLRHPLTSPRAKTRRWHCIGNPTCLGCPRRISLGHAWRKLVRRLQKAHAFSQHLLLMSSIADWFEHLPAWIRWKNNCWELDGRGRGQGPLKLSAKQRRIVKIRKAMHQGHSEQQRKKKISKSLSHCSMNTLLTVEEEDFESEWAMAVFCSVIPSGDQWTARVDSLPREASAADWDWSSAESRRVLLLPNRPPRSMCPGAIQDDPFEFTCDPSSHDEPPFPIIERLSKSPLPARASNFANPRAWSEWLVPARNRFHRRGNCWGCEIGQELDVGPNPFLGSVRFTPMWKDARQGQRWKCTKQGRQTSFTNSIHSDRDRDETARNQEDKYPYQFISFIYSGLQKMFLRNLSSYTLLLGNTSYNKVNNGN